MAQEEDEEEPGLSTDETETRLTPLKPEGRHSSINTTPNLVSTSHRIGMLNRLAVEPYFFHEDLTFNVEEVQNIVRDNIEFCLGGNIYSHSRASQWITVITEKTLARLNKLNKPFKYIMRMTVTQKNGTGLHTAAAYFWDIATDGTCTVRWENKYMFCIVNVWALALQL